MFINQEYLDYFNRGGVENDRFWQRMGGKPIFKDKIIVDLGCGHGSMSVYLASLGAKKVIGLDLNDELIHFAEYNLHNNFSHLSTKVEFRVQDINQMAESDIDFFISKDTFEHVIKLDQVLDEMKKRLKSGGMIYAGFGPLWKSPFGAHGRYEMIKVPWIHLIFNENYYIDRLNRNKPGNDLINSTYDLGLNKLTLADYLNIFNRSGLSIKYLEINRVEKMAYKIFSLPQKISILSEYFTFNVYCILQKT